MEADFPEEYASFSRGEPDFALPGGGESGNTFAARIQVALTDIARRHDGGTVRVITHGGGLDVAHRLTTGRLLTMPRDYPVPNARPAWVEFDLERWTLIRWPEGAV